MVGDGSFTYDPARGLMVNHADAMEMQLVSDNNAYALNVQLTATGRVKTCSDMDNATHQVPGYRSLCITMNFQGEKHHEKYPQTSWHHSD